MVPDCTCSPLLCSRESECLRLHGVVGSLPAGQLAGVDITSVPAITVAVAKGFTSANLGASVTGTSTLSFLGITATSTASIVNSGCAA